MAYAEDVATLKQLEKYRLVGIVVAFAMILASVLFSWPLTKLTGVAWAATGGICVLEARVVKRLGRDATTSWLRAVVMFLVAIYDFL